MGGARGAPLGALGVGTFLPRGRTRPRAPFQAEGAQIGAQGPASRGRQKTASELIFKLGHTQWLGTNGRA